jgi:hypothetical protein
MRLDRSSRPLHGEVGDLEVRTPEQKAARQEERRNLLAAVAQPERDAGFLSLQARIADLGYSLVKRTGRATGVITFSILEPELMQQVAGPLTIEEAEAWAEREQDSNPYE